MVLVAFRKVLSNLQKWTVLGLSIVACSWSTLEGGEVSSMVVKEPLKAMEFAVGKKMVATIVTSKGTIECELYPEKAPLSVTNFINLVNAKFYEGLTFHRVVPGFVVQGGDPDGTGQGGPGYTVTAEIGLPHLKGALAWARLPDQVNPKKRSSGSQFYITLEATPFLDGEYTVFGQTVRGFDVISKLRIGDKIQSITIDQR